jgi:hypothetical protein
MQDYVSASKSGSSEPKTPKLKRQNALSLHSSSMVPIGRTASRTPDSISAGRQTFLHAPSRTDQKLVTAKIPTVYNSRKQLLYQQKSVTKQPLVRNEKLQNTREPVVDIKASSRTLCKSLAADVNKLHASPTAEIIVPGVLAKSTSSSSFIMRPLTQTNSKFHHSSSQLHHHHYSFSKLKNLTLGRNRTLCLADLPYAERLYLQSQVHFGDARLIKVKLV